MTNWKEELEMILDTDENIEAINIEGTLYEGKEKIAEALKRLEREFYDGYGEPQGESFWAWSQSNVFIIIVYDGSEWIRSIPRNPKVTKEEGPVHYGGW